METDQLSTGLEHKFCQTDTSISVTDGVLIQGYASYFGQCDKGGDVVERGAYGASLAQIKKSGGRVKMLWQHDPTQPIGIWDEVFEDEKGLFVKGRLLPDVAKGREAAALIEAGAIDGLSIGYRTKKAHKNEKGQRMLAELELWEVSLVTFPMLPQARVDAKGDSPEAQMMRDLVGVINDARAMLANS